MVQAQVQGSRLPGAEASIRGHDTDAPLMQGCGSPSTYIASLTSARSRRAALRGSSGHTAVLRHTPNTPWQNLRSGTMAHVRSRTEESGFADNGDGQPCTGSR